MDYCIVKYSRFICKISYDTASKKVVEQLEKNFKGYYHFSQDTISSEKIYVHIRLFYEKNINEFSQDIRGVSSIHSSHSINDKYLLNGKIYTQQDAKRYAKITETRNKNVYYIVDTQSIIKEYVGKHKVDIYGSMIYKDLEYIFELLLNSYFEQNQAIALHAASCVLKGEGIVICGHSGSGKTTLLIDLIEHMNAKFQANDRVLLFSEKKGLMSLSVPIPVNVPLKSLKKNDRWKNLDLIKNCPNLHAKIRFNVDEISLLFDKVIYSEVMLKYIFITKYKEKDPSIKKLSPEEAIDELDILTPYDCRQLGKRTARMVLKRVNRLLPCSRY